MSPNNIFSVIVVVIGDGVVVKGGCGSGFAEVVVALMLFINSFLGTNNSITILE